MFTEEVINGKEVLHPFLFSPAVVMPEYVRLLGREDDEVAWMVVTRAR